MNDVLTNELIITYVLFWYFLFYITKWMKDFRGASQNFYQFLTAFSSIGTGFGLIVLLSIAINSEWVNGLILMGISVVVNMILVIIESTITIKLLKIDYAVEKIGMVSFFVVPILAYRLIVLLGII
jgi:hypothetical protein